MAAPLGLLLLGKLAVLAATAFAGVRLRLLGAGPPTCGQSAAGPYECTALDPHVSPTAFYAPWVLTALTLLMLSLPTVLLQSRFPERGMQAVAGMFAHQTALMLWAAGLPRTMGYALALHACVHALLSIRWGHHLVGGPLWWGLRFPAAAGLVVLAALYGPPVSVVRWPGADSTDAVACATAAHLLACIVPDVALGLELGTVALAGWLFLQRE
jgi:hypothetical protein